MRSKADSDLETRRGAVRSTPKPLYSDDIQPKCAALNFIHQREYKQAARNTVPEKSKVRIGGSLRRRSQPKISLPFGYLSYLRGKYSLLRFSANANGGTHQNRIKSCAY
jgi:hypothetical protein